MSKIQRTSGTRIQQRYVYEIVAASVASWSPDPDPTGEPPTEVHMSLEVKGLSDELVMRLKTKAAVNRLIHALEEHRDAVWPPAAEQPQIARLAASMAGVSPGDAQVLALIVFDVLERMEAAFACAPAQAIARLTHALTVAKQLSSEAP